MANCVLQVSYRKGALFHIGPVARGGCCRDVTPRPVAGHLGEAVGESGGVRAWSG